MILFFFFFLYKKNINVSKTTKKKKKQQKVLPVNCNRMMTAGACPLTFWTVIIYKLKGYMVRGWPTLGPQAILRTLFPRDWSGKQVESDNTTAKKKKSPSMDGSVYS